MKKGITPIISIVLLVMITIAMVGFAWVWFSRVGQGAMNRTQTQIEQQQQSMQKTIRIDNINAASSVVYVRNTGTLDIAGSELTIYVGGVIQSCTWSPSTISPGSTASCDWSTGSCTSGTIVRITAPGNSDESEC
jgi:flagellin-like protein